MKKILVLFIFSAVTLSTFAQFDGELFGKFTDSVSHQPLIGAGVSLQQNGEEIFGNMTDDQGAFYFKPVPPGQYKLYFSYQGYGQRIYAVGIGNNDSKYLNLQVSQGTTELPPIIVIPEPIIDENTTDNITDKELDHLPVQSAIEAVAKTSPMIYSPDGGENGGLYIAGSRSDATLYVIDGVKVEGSAYVPKSAIAEITVYTMGIPAKYGDVTGGVIEIRTKNYSGIY